MIRLSFSQIEFILEVYYNPYIHTFLLIF